MDPQSAAFTPQTDYYRLEMLKVQHTQADHAERLARLERRQEDDARMKSVWGTSSPFPGVLSGTPQQAPLHQPPADAFSGFDDQHSLIGSLHLDADEEPRRGGATSRANSVRFDESANQSHWSHAHRSSLDLIPRSGSSLSSHPMIERTYSQKSDGRASSAGHSATSGRANSMGMDTPFSGLGTSPMETPNFAPGLLVLGSVPSIIRCWLSQNFKHDTLLYAAVCTGSHGSYLDEKLVAQLGYQEQIRDATDRKLKLPVYFPEATTRGMSSSRSSSPSPGLPSVTIEFTIVSNASDDNDKAIQIFIGSDVLRAHSADVFFSSNTITMYDDDRNKLSIPMVRPENDQTFKSLRITSIPLPVSHTPRKQPPIHQPSPLNGLRQTITNESTSVASPILQPSDRASLDDKSARPGTSDDTSTGSTRPSLDGRPSLASITTSLSDKSIPDQPPASTSRSTSSTSNIWGSWRQGAAPTTAPASSTVDSWAKAGQSYQRRNEGIKVLRPTKPVSRTVSANVAGNASSPSPVTASASQSRFFPASDANGRTSLEDVHKEKKDAMPGLGKTKSANPVGGASAFSWLSK